MENNVKKKKICLFFRSLEENLISTIYKTKQEVISIVFGKVY